MYLPMIYYPIREDQRATGFLLPTYGTSTVRGQAISNAFFWAINRSTDATFFHDWFTQHRPGRRRRVSLRRGRAIHGRRPVLSLRPEGRRRSTNDGETQTLAATKSYEITGNLNHALTRNIRARARLDYFTDLVTQQLYHQNLYQASRNRRLIEAGLTAAFGAVSTSVLYQRTELFSSETSSQVYGSTPRVTHEPGPAAAVQRADLRLGERRVRVPARSHRSPTASSSSDTGYTRLDVSPTVRVPLSRLTFLSLNTSAAYRATHYSRSAALTTDATVDEPYLRQYMTLRSEIVGPVFTRIWDLQGGFAERIKHVIEPAFTVDFTSHIDELQPHAGRERRLRLRGERRDQGHLRADQPGVCARPDRGQRARDRRAKS